MDKVFKQLSNFEFPFNNKKRNKGEIVLTGKSALLVWQYVRHNSSYRRTFNRLKLDLAKISDANDKAERAFEFMQEWSVSHPVDYRQDVLPSKFNFKFRRVLEVKNPGNLKTISTGIDFLMGDENIHRRKDLRPITILLNARAGKETLLRDVEAILDKRIRRLRGDTNYSLLGTDTSRVVENIFLYHCSRVRKLKPKETSEYYSDVFKKARNRFKTSDINDRCKTFQKVANISPWCFFEAVLQNNN